MKKSIVWSSIIIMAVAFLTTGSSVFASKSWNGSHQAPRYHAQASGEYGPCRAGRADLTEEQVNRLNEQRKAFFESTRDLRQKMYEKRMELKAVVAQSEPDNARAEALQKELSEMKAQFDQKRLEHVLKMKKISPHAGKGFMSGGRGGNGSGKGHGRGHGKRCGYGPGYGCRF